MGVARVSLAPGGFPATRTNHVLVVRARVSYGSGTLRAALYEGDQNRSGDLETSTLTASFVDYELAVPNAGAAAITDYVNLEIRFWEYAQGLGTVFEVAGVWLKTPATGAPTTVARVSLEAGTVPATRSEHALIIRARLASGEGVLRSALYEGASNRSGDLRSTPLTSNMTSYSLPIATADAEDITSYADLEVRLWGEGSPGATFDVAAVWLATGGSGLVRVGIASESSFAAALVGEQPLPAVIYPSPNLYPSDAYPSSFVIGIASEMNSAFTVTATGTAIQVLVGIASEVNSGLTRDTPWTYIIGIAAESNSVPSISGIGGALVVQVGIAVETSIGRLIGGAGAEISRAVIKDGIEDLVIAASYDPVGGVYDDFLVATVDELALLGSAISDEEVTDLWQRIRHVGSDGRAYDSTTGIWEGTTNLVVNGGFEGGVSPWTAQSSWTHALSMVQAKLGKQSLRVTRAASGSDTNMAACPVTLPSSGSVTVSAWIYIPGDWDGGSVYVIPEQFGSATLVASRDSGSQRDGWQRIWRTYSVPAGDLSGYVVVRTTVLPSQGKLVYIDGVQVERTVIVTPYAETNGVSTSRLGARVQMPAAYLDETEGWVAARLRLGWGNVAEPASDPYVLLWGDYLAPTYQNGLSLFYDRGNNRFSFLRTDFVSPARVNVNTSIAADDRVTVVAAWTASAVKLSINGAGFTTVAGTGIPAISAALADLGSGGDTGEGFLDGDFIWFACGTGTLTDGDARRFHDLSDEAPRLHTYPASAEVTFTWDGVDDFGLEAGYTHNLAVGPLRRIFHQAAARRGTTQFDLIDDMERLGTEMGVLEAATSEQMGEGIARILNAMGVEDPSRYDLDPGESGVNSVSNDGTQSWLDILAAIVLSDFGLFYLDGSGRYIFRERRSRPLAEYKGRISREMRAIQPGVDVDRIVNRWAVSAAAVPEGQTPPVATASFGRSTRRYRVRYSDHTAEHLRTSDQAYSLAEHLVRRTSEPDSPVYGVSLDNRSDRLLAYCLELEIGDMIGVLAGETIGYYIVEQVAAEASTEEGRHTVSLVISQV